MTSIRGMVVLLAALLSAALQTQHLLGAHAMALFLGAWVQWGYLTSATPRYWQMNSAASFSAMVGVLLKPASFWRMNLACSESG